MSDQPQNSGNSTPPPEPGIKLQVPESFYTKTVKPILGKLILAGVILILLIIVANIFLKSLKKDHTLELMQQKNKALEEERLVLIKSRDTLQAELKKSTVIIYDLLHNVDSVTVRNIENIYKKIDRLKLTNYENNKVIDGFGSDELLEYYRNIPDPNKSNDY